MAPAPRFLKSIVPARAMKQLRSLTVDVEMTDPHWRFVAGNIGPKLEGLRSLTIVARYAMDENLYDFGSIATLESIRNLIEERVWPAATLGKLLEQFIVHVHSGAGSTLAGRDPRFEPTYFLEHKDLPAARGLSDGRSFSKLVERSNNGLVRDAARARFVESIVCTAP
ncbi:uncharacterized protein PG998_011493 [Apiospora kogelbergensis]|uniref:uncharacterized protein n=1 Tax=Apiospora kogelbergensis TaxID=1337665 RepID=UPI00312CDD68